MSAFLYTKYYIVARGQSTKIALIGKEPIYLVGQVAESVSHIDIISTSYTVNKLI